MSDTEADKHERDNLGRADKRDRKPSDSRTTQQVVIPSEGYSKVRKGQVDWIEGLEKFSDLKSWLFKFRVGASIYLSAEVYPNAKERRQAWLYALVRSAILGKNDQMTRYLEVLDHKNVACEQLLEHLEKRFLPTAEFDKKRVIQKYRSFKRENRSLWDTYKAYQQLELECSKCNFNPGTEMNIAQLESLILPDEKVAFHVYVEREKERIQQEFQDVDDDDGIGGMRMTELEREEEAVRAAIEMLGKQLEERDVLVKKQHEKSEKNPFAGNTLSRGGKGGRGGKQFSQSRETNAEQQKQFKRNGRGGKWPRSGHPPRENDDEKSSKICKFCNQECAAVKGGKKEQCYAWGKECKKCGRKGHYQSVCRMKKDVANVAHSGGGEGGSSGAEGGKMSSGF